MYDSTITKTIPLWIFIPKKQIIYGTGVRFNLKENKSGYHYREMGAIGNIYIPHRGKNSHNCPLLFPLFNNIQHRLVQFTI